MSEPSKPTAKDAYAMLEEMMTILTDAGYGAIGRCRRCDEYVTFEIDVPVEADG